MSTPFRYYKKRERYEEYMKAFASVTDGLITASEAVQARYDFEKAWRDFTIRQKIRFAALRKAEYEARAGNATLPNHNYTSFAQSDEKFWEVKFNDAKQERFVSASGR